MVSKFTSFVYEKLKLPYALHIASDEGEGQPVIFLHGIASDSRTWNTVLPLSPELRVRAITFDLLGFGKSPNPDWPDYNLQDHAKSVARTIRGLRLKQKSIIVGHSMGSLIATQLATSYPKLVKQLVLCSIPLYSGDDFDSSIDAYKGSGRQLNNIYFSVYEKLIQKRDFTLNGAKQLESLSKSSDLDLSDANWGSFTKSLKNAIIEQDTLHQLEKLTAPIDIIYGTFDLLLLSKYYSALATVNKNIHVTSIPATHSINISYAKVVKRIISSYVEPQ